MLLDCLVFTSIFFVLSNVPVKCDTNQIEPRIVGGFTVPSIDGFKHQVSIRGLVADRSRYGSGHVCGGSLIDLRTVLTAAHCVHDGKRYLSASNYVISMGNLDRWVRDNNTVYINVAKIAGHKGFNKKTFEHDIALLTLAQDVPFPHPTAEPISLPFQSPVVGSSCQISGWGTTYYEGPQPSNLKAANLTINSKSDCNARTSHNGSVLNGMFCAGPFSGPNIVDSCQGDSGGPLVCRGLLVGITSNGVGCAVPDYPGVYIDVFHYREWIIAGDSSKITASFVIMLSAIVLSLSF